MCSRFHATLIVFALATAGAAFAGETPLYLDPERPIDARARDLVARMTLPEKVSQMTHDAAAIPRLGVPEYDWWNECLHGVARAGRATVFPQAIGLGATFDADLMHRIGTAISDEARAKHHASARAGRRDRYRGLTFWTPNVNIFRDPRWGRGQETYGEDPFLMAAMGTAFVRGLQGDHPRYLKVAATAKHFAVHSGPEGERHTFDAIASRKDMEETYLPAFQALVEAGVESVMCAYNRVNGEVACGSDFLLVETLRERWGFEGHVVSDCWAIRDFDEHHKVTADNAESAALALKKGTDLNCGNSYPSLLEAVERGLLTEAEIDASLVTLLKTRFKLGLFDPEELVPYAAIEVDVVSSPEHRRLAREAAVKSLVLLKNDGGLLPLAKDLKKVYVTGPLAADAAVLLGNYSGVSSDLATILEGVVEKVSPATMVSYRQGSLLDRDNVNPIDWYSGVAEDADVTLAVMGINNLLEGEEGAAIASPGKGDRFDVALPENQLVFLRKIREKAPKLVVILLGGSPMLLSEVHELADAVLMAWYPGEEGGRAVADVLFGDAAPSGRLPVTFPRSLDQLPAYDDYSMAGRTYRYMTEEPFYPFGFGLGYTRFHYGSIELSPATLTTEQAAAGQGVTVRVEVANQGRAAGEEVVQVYVSDLEASTTVPLASLAAFERVDLQPGERRTVELELPVKALELVDDDGRRVLEPGSFAVTAGGASPGARSRALGAPAPARAELVVQTGCPPVVDRGEPSPPPAPECANDRLTGYDGLLVLAPHPDDETLGFGGLIHEYLGRDKPVEVVVVTDGDAYCEACRFWKSGTLAGPLCDALELSNLATEEVDSFAEVRRGESLAAMAILGAGGPAFLGYPDTGLAAAWRNAESGEASRPLRRSDFSACDGCCGEGYGGGPATELSAETLTTALKARLEATSAGTLVATTHWLDSHGDHAALGGFVKRLNAELVTPRATAYAVIHAHTSKDAAYADCWYPGPEAPVCPCFLEGCFEAEPDWLEGHRRHRLRPDWPGALPDDADYGEASHLCLPDDLWSGPAIKLQAVRAYPSQLGHLARGGGRAPAGFSGLVDCNGYLLSFVRSTEAFVLLDGEEEPENR